MIPLKAALKIIAGMHYSPDTEMVAMAQAIGRVIAGDVVSDVHMPPFNKSAMDGYACRKKDLGGILEVIELIKPGKAPVKPVGTSQCSKIMTGAMLPENADCVVMFEDTESIGENRIRIVAESSSPNVCLKGEDAGPGDILLAEGTRVKAQHMAVLASAGCFMPMVYKMPRIGILSTGDELVEPQQTPGISQIRNSNAYQLASQVNRSGCLAEYVGIVKDRKNELKETVLSALENNDVLIVTGGASKGDFDFVPQVLEEIKMKILFNKLAIQPGKPIVFASNREKFCFGLSGNPVSSFIQFELIVRPFLDKLTGCKIKPVYLKLPIGKEYSRKVADREMFFPVKITGQGPVIPVEYHGSAHLLSLSGADGIANIQLGQHTIKKGTLVDVRLI